MESFIDVILSLYGDQEIYAFYVFLATPNHEKNRLYKGKISTLLNLLDNEDIPYSPSLIYPKEKNWVINTDYDLSFSTIGAETNLINKLVKRNKNVRRRRH